MSWVKNSTRNSPIWDENPSKTRSSTRNNLTLYQEYRTRFQAHILWPVTYSTLARLDRWGYQMYATGRVRLFQAFQLSISKRIGFLYTNSELERRPNGKVHPVCCLRKHSILRWKQPVKKGGLGRSGKKIDRRNASKQDQRRKRYLLVKIDLGGTALQVKWPEDISMAVDQLIKFVGSSGGQEGKEQLITL